MKKVFFVLAVGFFISMLSTFTMQARLQAPCPTGFSTVEHSWFSPFNDHTYTMCGCDSVEGYAASGSC